MIEIKTGDLLNEQASALVNAVNCEGVMGKGIALQFKQAFPEMFKAYRSAAQGGAVVIGEMHIFSTGRTQPPQYIVNFPTKQRWREPSRLAYIEAGLVDLVAQVKARKIESVAVPPLGSGLGGLAWPTVRALIIEAFAQLPDVRVLIFEPLR